MIKEFAFKKDRVIAGKYIVQVLLGGGYEGEVYKVTEKHTNITRALKLFYPHRNKNFKVSVRNVRKLQKLANSPLVINCISHEVILIKSQKVACIVFEYIEGEILGAFVSKQKMKRLGIFPAIHLLYSIISGVESIHRHGEYHGDLHVDNIIIRRFGLEFDLRIIDLHHWGDSKKDNRHEDLIKTIKIFYDILGGSKRYKHLPQSIKYIICGLKRSLILNRFKTAADLRIYLEKMDWSDAI